jgi:hypothetical protein
MVSSPRGPFEPVFRLPAGGIVEVQSMIERGICLEIVC